MTDNYYHTVAAAWSRATPYITLVLTDERGRIPWSGEKLPPQIFIDNFLSSGYGTVHHKRSEVAGYKLDEEHSHNIFRETWKDMRNPQKRDPWLQKGLIVNPDYSLGTFFRCNLYRLPGHNDEQGYIFRFTYNKLEEIKGKGIEYKVIQDERRKT